jgi:hypothetical protein
MTLFNWGNKSEPMRAAYQKDYVNEMEIHMVLRLSHNLGLLAYTEAYKRLKQEENRQESVVLVAQAKGLGGTL